MLDADDDDPLGELVLGGVELGEVELGEVDDAPRVLAFFRTKPPPVDACCTHPVIVTGDP